MYYLWYIVKSAFIDFWRYEVMEFWRFIFSSFWVWLGFVILVSMVGGGIIELVKTCNTVFTKYGFFSFPFRPFHDACGGRAA